MMNPLTPEQEAEARYPYEAPQVKIQIYSGDYQKVLQTVFVEGAEWRGEQSKKDKERINELESFVKSIGLMKDESGESSYDQIKAGYAMGYNKCLERIQNEAENLFNKPTL